MSENEEMTVFVLTSHNLKDDARVVGVYASRELGRAAAGRLADCFDDGYDYASEGDIETWTEGKEEWGYMLQPRAVNGFEDEIEQGLSPCRQQSFAAIRRAGYHIS